MSKTNERNEAWQVVKGVIDNSGDNSAIEALQKLRPSLYGLSNRGTGAGLYQQLVDFIVEKGEVKLIDVFSQFKIGERESLAYLRVAMRKAAPAERTYINYDKGTEIFTYLSKGVDVPADYTGYTVPAVVEVDSTDSNDALFD